MTPARPLEGFRILDLSQFLPGPFAAQLLGDLGAEIVKVEPPGGEVMRHMGLGPGGDGLPGAYRVLNAGKTVVELDLKREADRARFLELAAAADGLVESFRPGTLERLGLGRAVLAEAAPRLVHVALSGWGQEGPYRLRAGHDLNYMAIGGGLAMTGPADRPTPTYPMVADYAGAVMATLACVAGLLGRARTGRGSYLDVSLMESVLQFQALALTDAARGGPPRRGAHLLNGGAACYNIYRTQDGRFVTLGIVEPKFWQNFCQAVGRPDWQARQFETLPQTDLIAEVASLFATRRSAEWEALLGGIDACFAPVLEPADVPDDPHLAARGQIVRSAGAAPIVEVLLGIRQDGAPPVPRAAVAFAPAAEILARWRMSAEG